MKKTALWLGVLLSGAALAQSPRTLTVFTTYKKANAEAVAAAYNAELSAHKAQPVTFKFMYGSNEDAAQQLAELKEADVIWLSNAYFFDLLPAAQAFSAPKVAPVSAVALPKMNAARTWLPLSVHLHGLTYNKDTLKPDILPKNLIDLPKVSALKGRIAWGVNNPSFTEQVAALIAQYGEDATKQWLLDMQKLEPRDYGSELNGLTEAVNRGEVDVALGLSSNATRGRGSSYHIGLYSFAAGDVGNLAEFSGVAALKGPQQAQALSFARYLSTAAPQIYMSTVNFDQPLYVADLLPANAIPKDYEKIVPTLERRGNQPKAIKLFEEVGLW